MRDLEVWGQLEGGALINIGQEPLERRKGGGSPGNNTRLLGLGNTSAWSDRISTMEIKQDGGLFVIS